MIVKLLDIIKAILFGIVEGITEWLPVSSTGHMSILESIFDVKESYGEAFWNLFLVVIQLGAILAVIICFFNKLNPFFGKSLVDNNKKKDK
ncbi:MAG: undecaprenyl-diphosphatase, partial [Erysipelotrichaceae bacterium]|nr:undecaprenyl-diphosphatase [Erysipelotrichaceae bacterium]